MKNRLTLILFLCAVTLPCIGAAQETGAAFLGNFDKRLLHYGIQVGYTQSKFDLHYSEDAELREDLQSSTSYYSPGFHINVIGDMRVSDYLNLRLLPGISLLSRNIYYGWSQSYQQSHYKWEDFRTVESVYGELPIELKYRSMRYHNFRPYLTLGGSYGFDFASLRKHKNNSEEGIIKLGASDIRYTTGVGFDVFLRYVKFAVEFKMAFGVIDLKVPDNDLCTRSVDYLKSRTFMLSFTFEG